MSAIKLDVYYAIVSKQKPRRGENEKIDNLDGKVQIKVRVAVFQIWQVLLAQSGTRDKARNIDKIRA